MVSTTDIAQGKDAPARRIKRRWRRVPLVRRSLFRLRWLLGHSIFSSLTRRIVFLNLVALLVLVTGILWLNQFRQGLIESRIESLHVQAQIIASAIASSATVETNSITLDPERLLELQAGATLQPGSEFSNNLDFPINPEEAGRLLRQLISPTRTRARIYDRDANLILDTRHLTLSGSGGQVLRYGLPPIQPEPENVFGWAAGHFTRFFRDPHLAVCRDPVAGPGTNFPEVMDALTGVRTAERCVTESGELIVLVAVPIQRFRAVLGVLLLSTQGGDIDEIVQAERMAIVRVFAVAAFVTIFLSILLASTIANPLRRLSAAAIRVRRSVNAREEIPDFGDRADEVGNLASALRGMTNALYARMDAIESFAADVSHELKNPLTSLRSAVETLPLARNEDSRQRLLGIIQHDVKRLDRLITDISDASRLDAELAREASVRVDIGVLLGSVVEGARAHVREGRTLSLDYVVAPTAQGVPRSFTVAGHDLRLGQVFTNLIENARSFVPEDAGRISVRLQRLTKRVIVTIEDNGPGIQAEKIERIFERFYTDRPAGEAFGQNSGLGLSISRQIIEAHGGTITPENIVDKADPKILRGARFTVALPADR